MNTVTAALQPSLPWTTTEEDRRFRRILVLSLLFFVLLAGLVSWLPVTPLQVAANMTPPLRLARIIEATVTPDKPAAGDGKPAAPSLPAPPRPAPSVSAARAPVERKPEPATPREQAAHSGVLAMSKTLDKLSQAMPRIAMAGAGPQQDNHAGAHPRDDVALSRLTAGITRGSGGLGGAMVSYGTLLGAMDGQGKTGAGAGGSGGAGEGVPGGGGSGGAGTGRPGTGGSESSASGVTRSREEIQEILERNKPAIYRLYNNALRRDPELQGHVLMSITIAPSGQVTACSILFSELKAAALEAQLVALVRRIDFGAKPEARLVTTKVPIEFFPL